MNFLENLFPNAAFDSSDGELEDMVDLGETDVTTSELDVTTSELEAKDALEANTEEVKEDAWITIYVNQFADQTLTIRIDPHATGWRLIKAVKSEIKKRASMNHSDSVADIFLVFAGILLKEDTTLDFQGLQDESHVLLVTVTDVLRTPEYVVRPALNQITPSEMAEGEHCVVNSLSQKALIGQDMPGHQPETEVLIWSRHMCLDESWKFEKVEKSDSIPTDCFRFIHVETETTLTRIQPTENVDGKEHEEKSTSSVNGDRLALSKDASVDVNSVFQFLKIGSDEHGLSEYILMTPSGYVVDTQDSGADNGTSIVLKKWADALSSTQIWKIYPFVVRKKVKKRKKKKKRNANLGAAAEFEENKLKEDDDVIDMSELQSLTIETTVEGRDMLTLQRQSSGKSPRYLMPCQHVISAQSLTAFCESSMNTPSLPTEFVCPEPSCGSAWPYPLVRKVAKLTKKQREEFEIKLSDNYLDQLDIASCPKCKSKLFRKWTGVLLARCMVCKYLEPSEQISGQIKRAFYFCWKCRSEWKEGQNPTLCGNEICAFSEKVLRGDVLKILSTCAKKSIGSVHGVPEYRSCPMCGQLISHIEACKHMSCTRKRCGTNFCFVCLSVNEGGWKCGGAYDSCDLAAVQTDEQLPRWK